DINSHNEWTQSRINTDENDVQHIIKCFKSCSPFALNGECVLRNIVTGELAEESTSRCLLNVKENGEALLTTYEKERFSQETKKLSDRIQKTKFFNFKETPSKSNKNAPNKKLQDVTDITIFQKSFMTASERGLNTRILASYELLNYCKYLFDSDGFYRKSPKSQLLVEVEKNYNCGTSSQKDVINLNAFKVYIIDGMALVYKIQLKKFNTFGDFAEVFFKKIMEFYALPG
ncbi:hypothetical protein WA026_013074, partial [Henosepilachna vigintioctopunctata]